LKEELPEKIMWASQGMCLAKKGEKKTIAGGPMTKATLEQMEECLVEVEKSIMGVSKLFTEDQISWWTLFFKEQRLHNISLVPKNRPLTKEWRWPETSTEDIELNHMVEVVAMDIDMINDRVYGPTRDIYVGPYRNQRMIDLEKENMEG
jgi:hypothetical protein